MTGRMLIAVPRIAILVLAASGPSHAQQTVDPVSPPVFGERVEVRLMEIDVVVESAVLGKPIAGLTKRDFLAYEDGEPREVVDVTGGPESRKRSDTEPGVTADSVIAEPPAPRSFLLAFDFESISLQELARAVPGLQRFVEENASPSIHWSVVVLGNTPYAVTDWTTESAEVVLGLDHVLELRRGVGTSVWALGSFLAVPDSLLPFDPASLLSPEGAAYEQRNEVLEPGASLDDFRARLESFRTSVSSSLTAGSLDRLLYSLRAPGGDATIVLHYASQVGSASGSLNSDAILSSARGMRSWDRAAARANAAGYRIHATDLRGLNLDRLIDSGWTGAAGGGLSSRNSSLMEAVGAPGALSFAVQDGATMVAVQTGGRDTQSNAWDAGLRRALEDARNHYRLTIRLHRPADGRRHRLRVALRDRPHARLRYRRSHVDLPPRQMLETQLAGSGNVPRSGGAFPLDLVFRVDAAAPGEGLLGQAALSTPLTRLGLIEQEDGSHRGSVVAYLAVYGADGQRVHLEQAERPLLVSAESIEQGTDALTFNQTFDVNLPPGSWTLTGAIYDTVDQTTSVATRRIRSPAASTPANE